MKLFTKKDNLKQTIPFIGIMTALNLVLIVLGTYIPFAGYIFILFLPLVSTLYSLNTKYRYFPIYFIASILLSILCTLSDFSTTLLYLVPSLISGLIFSICINKNINFHFGFMVNSLVLFLSQIAFIPLIDFIYSIHTINNILTVFGLQNSETINTLIYALIYLICCIEILLVYLLVNDQLKKFKYGINNSKIDTYLNIFALLCALLAAIFILFNLIKLVDLFIAISLVSSIFISIELITNKYKFSYFLVPIIAIIAWLFYVLLLQKNSGTISLIALTILPVTCAIASLIIIISDRIKTRRIGKR